MAIPRNDGVQIAPLDFSSNETKNAVNTLARCAPVITRYCLISFPKRNRRRGALEPEILHKILKIVGKGGGAVADRRLAA